MEKKKINLDVTFEQATRIFTDKNGNDVAILQWIPAAEKEAFAMEQVTQTMGTNEELGLCYRMMAEDEIYAYLLVKYYTDIDVSEITEMDDFRKLYDYCQQSGLLNDVDNYVPWEEKAVIEHMEALYREAIQKLYEAEHSLGYRVKQLLDTDVDTNNAETRELIEKLIDMKGTMLEKEEQGKVLEFVSTKNGKKKPASVKTGGVSMSLAKR